MEKSAFIIDDISVIVMISEAELIYPVNLTVKFRVFVSLFGILVEMEEFSTFSEERVAPSRIEIS